MRLDADIPAFCRDCYHIQEAAKHCSACRSPRMLAHADLFSLSIAHMDCDAFYASVEKRDNPDLKSKPVIVGGSSGRGVVTTACYLARMSGVHSAMPMYKAKKLCPGAEIVPPRMKAYKVASRAIRAKMEQVTPLVEPISIDEAFMDLSGTEKVHSAPPALTLARLANEIEKEVGITVSIGLAPNKFLAKLTSSMNKPRGFSVLGENEVMAHMASLPVSAIWGVGNAMATKLRKDGITMVSQLQSMDEKPLAKRYGELGLTLYRLSRGLDNRKVSPKRETKSISAERTLAKDIWQLEDIVNRLWPLAEEVSEGLKKQGFAAGTVTLKLKTQQHKSLTRSVTLAYPTQLAEVMFEEVNRMAATMADGTYYRLIGLAASNLSDPRMADQPDLIEPDRNRRANNEKVMDQLRAKFGKEAIKKGRSLKD